LWLTELSRAVEWADGASPVKATRQKPNTSEQKDKAKSDAEELKR